MPIDVVSSHSQSQSDILYCFALVFCSLTTSGQYDLPLLKCQLNLFTHTYMYKLPWQFLQLCLFLTSHPINVVITMLLVITWLELINIVQCKCNWVRPKSYKYDASLPMSLVIRHINEDYFCLTHIYITCINVQRRTVMLSICILLVLI